MKTVWFYWQVVGPDGARVFAPRTAFSPADVVTALDDLAAILRESKDGVLVLRAVDGDGNAATVEDAPSALFGVIAEWYETNRADLEATARQNLAEAAREDAEEWF